MGAVSWRDMVAAMDAAVDTQWAESIRFMPWIAGEYDDGEPDLSRAVLTTMGIMRLDKEVVTGGGPNERVGSTFGTRMATAPVRVSISKTAMQAAVLREGDRIRALERIGTVDEWFEIERFLADASGRVEISLKRLGRP
jgi:hypothetical protein